MLRITKKLFLAHKERLNMKQASLKNMKEGLLKESLQRILKICIGAQ